MLATNDAHSLYNQYCFEQIVNPELFMQKELKSISTIKTLLTIARNQDMPLFV
ncbi:hypothetical protein [Bacillus sp. AFS031507]|uniref:hypothetical protein n=1 Tax=Bacillus sp. AFS031507 TaxID=2033496 RepID=UPI00211F2721|nr:hypothetical protein [Bacillus sp. AFS031507]